jgi:Arc/MetJ-type ribon-helix-helix transcriptional regulator
LFQKKLNHFLSILTIALNPKQEEFTQAQLSTGQYTDAAAVITESLRSLKKRNHYDEWVEDICAKIDTAATHSIGMKVSMKKLRSLNLEKSCNKPANSNSQPQYIIFYRVINNGIEIARVIKGDKVKVLKNKAKETDLTPNEKKELSDGEKEYKSKRKQIQEKPIKFATRIPAFMYLTDFRENTQQDEIAKLEPDLFLTVTGLTVKDFHLLVQLKVFNTEHMNQAVFAFRRYEDASLRYTGIESHPELTHYGLYDTVVAKE